MAKACLRGLEEVEDRLKGSLEEDRLKGSLEDSCGEADQDCMPFANERAGTIKYKTNPQVYIQTFFQANLMDHITDFLLSFMTLIIKM